MRACHGVGPVTCAHCGYTTDSKKNIKNHLKKHWNERRFVCDIDGCGKAYKFKTNLTKHKVTHDETLIVIKGIIEQ